MESEVHQCPTFGGPAFDGCVLDPVDFGCGSKVDGASIFNEGVDSIATSSNNINFSFQVGDDDGVPIPTTTETMAAALHAPPQAMASLRERHRVYVKSGVTVEVTEDHLQRHFSTFGNITDVYIPRVVPSQIPKGFAYVSFDSEDAVLRVLELESHEINGKHFPIGRAEPRPSERGVWHRDQGNIRRQHEYNQPYATWGGQEPRSNGLPMHYSPPSSVSWGPPLASNVEAPIDPPYNPEAPYYHTEEEPYGWMPGPPRGGPGNVMMKRNACRIFVGGVPDVLLEEDMRIHFEKYGKVEDVYFPKEKETRKRRGFCYVRFDNPKAADAAAARSPRTIGGHEIGEIKIAQPRPGDTPYFDFHHQTRNDYGYGGYGPQRMGNSYHSRSFEGRPPSRFRPY